MSDNHRGRTKNAILVRDDVGKARPTCYDLPHEAHAYGRAEPADLEGAREVTMHWAAHVPRPKPDGNVQDFMKLNRMAATSGVSNATDLKYFKQGRDVKLIPKASVSNQPKVIPSDVIPSFAYGRKSRPSTPVNAVVGYQYAAEYEESLANMYARYESEAPPAKSKVRLTKSSRALIMHSAHKRASVDKREEPELFKLTKFKKVSSRLQLAPLNKAQSAPILN
jgi:hypothetical protein